MRSFEGTTFASCYKLKDLVFHSDNPYYTFDGKAVYTKDYGQIVHILPSYAGVLSLPDACRTVQWSSLRSGKLKGFVGKNVIEIGGHAFADLWSADYLAFGSKLKRVGIGPFSYARLNKLFWGVMTYLMVSMLIMLMVCIVIIGTLIKKLRFMCHVMLLTNFESIVCGAWLKRCYLSKIRNLPILPIRNLMRWAR